MSRPKTIADRVFDAAAAAPHHMTRTALAEAIGMTYAGVRKWGLPEGGSRPTKATLAKIREVLGPGATPEWVLFGIGPGPTVGGIDPNQEDPEDMRIALTLAIPFLMWSEVSMVTLFNDNPALHHVRRVAASRTASKRTKQLEVPDDSMAPTLVHGDAVQVEPGEEAAPGDVVLVKDGEGRHYLREYRERPGGFDAHPHNPVYATLESKRDGLSLIAVATHYVRSLRRKT